jgi:hypothetical protein
MDWERFGRLIVTLGVAGIFGVVGRLVAVWVRRRFTDRA